MSLDDSELRKNTIDFLKLRFEKELKDEHATIAYDGYRIVRLPVDVNIVENDVLNIDKFKK